MPIEPPDQKFFEAAGGYTALGMFREANEELEKLIHFFVLRPKFSL